LNQWLPRQTLAPSLFLFSCQAHSEHLPSPDEKKENKNFSLVKLLFFCQARSKGLPSPHEKKEKGKNSLVKLFFFVRSVLLVYQAFIS
jgi:hypothetical protein